MAAASVQVLRSATLGTALMGPDELGTAPSRRSFSRAGSRGFPSTRGSGSPAATRGSGTPAGAQGQHAGERRRCLLGGDFGMQVPSGAEVACFGTDADARGDLAARSIIELRGVDERAHASLAVVVRGLQQRRGFSGVHRRVIEIELGHADEVCGVSRQRCRRRNLSYRRRASPRRRRARRVVRDRLCAPAPSCRCR